MMSEELKNKRLDLFVALKQVKDIASDFCEMAEAELDEYQCGQSKSYTAACAIEQQCEVARENIIKEFNN